MRTNKMKKLIYYVTCFAIGYSCSYLLESKKEQQITPNFDARLIEVLSEYEEN